MAIINCPDCGREVSDHASSCPQCGATIARSNTFYTAIAVGTVIALLGIFTGLYIAHTNSPQTAATAPADSTLVATDTPSSPQQQQARSEAADWQEARTANTTDAYLEYLTHHPDGQHTNEARDSIEALARHIAIPQDTLPAPDEEPDAAADDEPAEEEVADSLETDNT